MNQPMETGITLYDRIQDPIVAVEKLGNFFAKSGMFGCTKVEQGMVMAMMCLARRMDPLEVAGTWHIMDMGGKINVTMKYDAMLAKLRTSAGGDYKVISRTADRAEIEITDKRGKTERFAFTWEEAQKEPFVWKWDKELKKQVWKDKWATPRGRMQMLWARVVSDGIRVMAPEVNFGTYVPEEAEDEPATVAPSVVQTGNGEDKPIDVQTVPEPPKEKPFEAAATGDGMLTVETMVRLSNGIPEPLQNAATAWLVANGWLKDGAPWQTLSVQRAQRILNNVAGFCAAIEQWAKQQEAGTKGAEAQDVGA